MRVLITGVTGYIGRHLARTLTAAGHEVIGLARTREPRSLPTERFRYVQADVMRLETVRADADVAIHLACANGSRVVPELDYGLTVGGTRNVLDLCRRNQITRVIFFSTLQVYGEMHGRSIDEETPPQPINDYGLSHRMAEELCEMAARNGEVRAVTLRPSILYGELDPEVPRWSITPGCFVREAVEQATITLTTNGSQFRNYAPMTFAGAVVAQLVARSRHWPPYDVFNISSPETLTVRDLAERAKLAVERVAGKRIRLAVNEQDKRTYARFDVSAEKVATFCDVHPRPRLDAALDEMASLLTRRGAGNPRQGAAKGDI